jgi:hypothetical protein
MTTPGQAVSSAEGVDPGTDVSVPVCLLNTGIVAVDTHPRICNRLDCLTTHSPIEEFDGRGCSGDECTFEDN